MAKISSKCLPFGLSVWRVCDVGFLQRIEPQRKWTKWIVCIIPVVYCDPAGTNKIVNSCATNSFHFLFLPPPTLLHQIVYFSLKKRHITYKHKHLSYNRYSILQDPNRWQYTSSKCWILSVERNRRPDYYTSGLILGLRPANERRRYIVTTSLIGWAQA